MSKVNHETLIELAGESRAARFGLSYVGTVRQFADYLLERDSLCAFGDYEGRQTPLQCVEGLVLVADNGRAIHAPTMLVTWKMLADSMDRDERLNPFVCMLPTHGPKNFTMECSPRYCPMCGQNQPMHDGVVLKCEACGWRKGLKAR